MAALTTDPKSMALAAGVLTALLTPVAVKKAVTKWPKFQAALASDPKGAMRALRVMQIGGAATAAPIAGGLYGLKTGFERDTHAQALAHRKSTGKLRKSERVALKQMGIRS